MARFAHPYDDNNLARVFDDGKWYLIDKEGKQVGETFVYIEEWGEGYYKVERGVKKNIMRPDGTLVLREWHHDIYKVTKGYILFRNVIRKSKTNPQKRYTYGLAHVNGIVIFPMIFSYVHWTKEQKSFYAEIDGKPYILTLNGGIYDPMGDHLPPKVKVDKKLMLEKILNWTLPGLQFFYRDTDAPIDVNTIYHVGDVLRAGFFIDVTTKLLRPAHKTRFLIASAHTAMLCYEEDFCKNSPNVPKWGLCTLHFNSFFKVMDVYEKDGFTQIFLLHIPKTAAYFLGNGETTINFVNEAANGNETLVEMARRSLDEKLCMNVHARSKDKELIERMHHPVGLDNDYHLVPLEPAYEAPNKEIANLSSAIHRLAADADIKVFETEDNFPYSGIEGSICEGCIYAKGIPDKGRGCGRLFIKSFRERYLKGRCEYRKTDLFIPSEFEKRGRYEREEAKNKSEKQSDTFALRTVNEFIEEVLDGDIHKLIHLDLSRIDNDKYCNKDLSRSNIVKSIMALVFADAWPDLSVASIEEYNYRCSTMNESIRLLGSNIFDEYFMGLKKFNPTKEMHEKALKAYNLLGSIGNFWVLPNKGLNGETLSSYKNSTPHYRGYVDKYLQAIYDMFADKPKVDIIIKGLFYKNRKLMVDYNGVEGFDKFINNMMLQDYVDEQGLPRDIFMMVWNFMKGLDRNTYLKAVDIFCNFCIEFIPLRSKRIITKLEQILTDKPTS